jgi:S-formylglutathione hydrolase FrmB
VAAVALALPAAATATDTPVCVPRSAQPQVGLTEVSRDSVTPRLLDIRVRSEAMQDVQPLYVLLPRNYDPSGKTRYPVLYLLHGAFGDYTDWIAHGVEGALGDAPYIVVMPDDGKDGSYSDWYGMLPGSTDPVPSWESYHIAELVPWVDRTFPTDADREHRFVAGLSSGGGGAVKYAAAHPGLFGAAGSFSGAVDTIVDYPLYPAVSEVLWGVTALPGYGPPGNCTWGDFATQQVVWRDNTGTPMAENLRGTPLFLASGNGSPGPYDSDAPYVDPTEYEVNRMNAALVSALDAEKIPYTADFYGAGHHSWPYWMRDLGEFLRWLKPRVGANDPAPSPFSFHLARDRFSVWGWDFVAHRAARENTYLRDVTRRGLTVIGSGTLDVTTPAVYAPGATYLVSSEDGSSPVQASADRRLRFTVDLGPAHTDEQTSFDEATIAGWTHRTIQIEREHP